MLRSLRTSAAAQQQEQPVLADAYQRLAGKRVYRASDAAHVELTSLWRPDETCVVAFARSFG